MSSKSEIKKLILDGNSVKKVAKLTGVSVQYVYKVINKGNMKKNIAKKSVLIMGMLYDGISDEEISKRLSVSRSTVYRAKRNEAINASGSREATRLTEWSTKTFYIVQEISNKYKKILSMKGIYIDTQEIESVLLDLMIHTDQKDIENKDAYFRKYCPLKIKNLGSKFVKNKMESLSDNDMMDRVCINDLDPEKILLIKERCGKYIK